MKLLVTGGTGVLGRELVQRLQDRADVQVLSRRAHDEPGFVRGDLDTGEGLAEAVKGVDAIAHCASAADYRRPQRDIDGTRRLIDAVGDERPHLVYISIVGVDRIPFGYYQAKLAIERLIAESGLPWTVLRTTQFHDLALLFMMLLAKGPVAIMPRGFRGQPVDTGEVADRMAELVLGPPAGRVPDMGGPRVEDGAETMREFLAATHRRKPILQVPLPGKVAAGFRSGNHLLSDGVRGKVTFEEYLRSRIRPDGTFDTPYEFKWTR